MKNIFLLVSFVSHIISYSLLAQGNLKTGPEVAQCIYHDTSPPLRDIPEVPSPKSNWRNKNFKFLETPRGIKGPYQYQSDSALQKTKGTRNGGFVAKTWDGISARYTASPPDPTGDVGPNHYMLATNHGFQIWNKTGTSLLGPLNLGTIWSGFPGPWSTNLNDGDPIVLYDEAADRWFIAQFSLPNGDNGPTYILVAISQTNDPTGSWHRYGFSYDNFADYPKFGIWPDGYYMAASHINGNYFDGVYLSVFERSQMLNGAAARSVTFTTPSYLVLLPSDWNGPISPPSATPNYFVGIHDDNWLGGSDGLDVFSFAVNWTIPDSSKLTGPVFISGATFTQLNYWPTVPQLGTSNLLDHLGNEILMNLLYYRNFGSHQSMVVCHTIDTGSERAGKRWYELRNTGGGWTIYQQGTYAPADGLHRWMGSIAINASGDIAMGYSISGTTMYPAIAFTGRYSADPLGQMAITEEIIFAGTGYQAGERWGDYTQMVVDPDGNNFWYVNQYQQSDGYDNWRTRIFMIDYTNSVEVGSDDIIAPEQYSLSQNFPNPFNPSTSIKYTIPNVTLSGVERSRVQLKVFDVIGSEVATLVNEERRAGNYEVKFNSSHLSSGIYFYRLQAGSFVETKKMILIR